MKYNNFIFLLIIISLFILPTSFGPPNCNLFEGDCKEACHECEQAIMHGQGTRKLQIHFDKAIDLCPTFGYAYYEKAVPYAKRGLIREWKVMIDKAVESEPEEFLGTRAWYHYFFMHNYEASIKDINKLEKIMPDIGFTGDGFYHLNIMKALCLNGLGDSQKGITLIENQIKQEGYALGLYDYLTLSAMQIITKEYESALENLNLQIEENDISEIYYYKAKIYKLNNDLVKANENIDIALDYYDADKKMKNSYRQLAFEIFRQDIIDLQNQINR